ncbi:MAG TPA: hypothetical protein VHS03_14305 [Gaiellaceae bacterium]|nr:hypothetical protein [Gaiellaceae bacterium]
MKVLIDQLGLELEQEGGPGRLAHDVAERRALRSLESVPKATEPDGVDPADPISAARASFEAALVAERTQLEAPLNDAREALQASLTASPPEPGTATPEAPVEPSATDPETSATPVVVPTPLLIPSPEESHMDESQPVNVSLLVRQAEELREELARESAFHATALEEATRELDTRVTDLQAELAHEREQHEQVAAALERAQRDARREASELRAAVNRLKSELAQIDAATGWFEYWSGAAGRKPNA